MQYNIVLKKYKTMSTFTKPYFSLDDGLPIANVYGNKEGSQYLGLDYEEPYTELDIETELEMVSDLLAYDEKNRRQISDREQIILEDCIADRIPPMEKNLKSIYLECLERLESSNVISNFRLQTGLIQPIPTLIDEQTDRLYIVGPSGSGKTIFISLWCLEYSKMHPDNKIVVFSRKKYDKNLDMVPGLIRINLDETFKDWLYLPEEVEQIEEKVEEKVEEVVNQAEKIVEIKEETPKITEILDEEIKTRKPRKSEILKHNHVQENKKGKVRKDFLDELEFSVCIFDDIDVIADDFIREEVRKLRDDLLETGRDREISVIATSHQINNYNLTRKVINESTALVLFPYSGAADQVKTFFKNKMSLDNTQIKTIMTLPTRWLYISKNSPRYIIYEHGAIFI